jgi:hypothetical protein
MEYWWSEIGEDWWSEHLYWYVERTTNGEL